MRRAERRIADLLRKADAVDKVEHDRVTAALTAAQEQLVGAQAEVDRLTPLQASVSQLKQEAEDMQAKLASVQVLTASLRCKCLCNTAQWASLLVQARSLVLAARLVKTVYVTSRRGHAG